MLARSRIIRGSPAPSYFRKRSIKTTLKVRTREIIAKYRDVTIIYLQEVAAVFAEQLKLSGINTSHHVFLPAKLDGKRDQNSIVLMSKDTVE